MRKRNIQAKSLTFSRPIFPYLGRQSLAFEAYYVHSRMDLEREPTEADFSEVGGSISAIGCWCPLDVNQS
jgi:hypothetical protein